MVSVRAGFALLMQMPLMTTVEMRIMGKSPHFSRVLKCTVKYPGLLAMSSGCRRPVSIYAESFHA